MSQIIVVEREINGGVSYNPVEIADYKSVEGEKFASYSFVMDVMRKLMGRTLTLIDASVVSKTQNKAMKDVVRNIFSDEMNFTADMLFDQKVLDEMISKDLDLSKVKQVSIEEALGVEETE